MNIKLNYCLFFTVFIPQLLFAQQRDPVIAKLYYEFIHINDTTARDQYHEEEMVLLLGQQASYYTTNSTFKTQEMVRKQLNDPGFDGNLKISGKGATSSESYYTNPAEQSFQMIYNITSAEKFRMEQAFPVLHWKIEDEHKTIGGYAVQKASVNFKGRRYTAWFTPELPFQAGPWKLHGLPGLILDASDDQQEVVFRYVGFEQVSDSGSVEETLEHTMPIGKKALDRKVQAFQQNPQAYMKAQRGSFPSSPLQDFDVSKLKSVSVEKLGVTKSKTTNNPIEREP